MTLAEAEFGLKVVERAIDRSELFTADEVFITGSAAGLQFVRAVDHRTIGDGTQGPIAKKLAELYDKVVRGAVPGLSRLADAHLRQPQNRRGLARRLAALAAVGREAAAISAAATESSRPPAASKSPKRSARERRAQICEERVAQLLVTVSRRMPNDANAESAKPVKRAAVSGALLANANAAAPWITSARPERVLGAPHDLERFAQRRSDAVDAADRERELRHVGQRVDQSAAVVDLAPHVGGGARRGDRFVETSQAEVELAHAVVGQARARSRSRARDRARCSRRT